MVRHLRVRSKLLLLIAAPLIGLLVFAGLNVSTRLEAVAEARTVEGLAQVAQRVDTLLTSLQRERRLSGQAADQREAGALEEAREATDRAAQALPPSTDEVPDEPVRADLSERIERLERELDEVTDLRETVDAGEAGRGAVERDYSAVVASVMEVQRFIGGALSGSEAAHDLAALAGLSALIEVVTREELLVGRALEAGEFTDRDYANYVAQLAVADSVESETLERMRTRHREAYRGTTPAWSDPIRRVRQEAMRSSEVISVDPAEFASASVGYEERLQEVSALVAGDIVAEAAAAGAEARTEAARSGGLTVGVAALALLLSILVTQQTVRPITRLTELSQEISQERLPKLVDTMRRGGADAAELEVEPIDIDSRDEIGRLAGAFDEIRAVAVRTATDLSEVTRKGISDLFVNLARRNQSLLDRQITVLDQLEQDEDDPDALEQLFTLDHLATRMRRNAESLLVLAGAETPRRWSQPVPLEEVVRAAIGEVEAYARVRATGLQDRMVSGRAAADMAHLLAELLENATVYSPPTSPVTVTTRSSEDGLVVSITDRGLGMGAEALAEANSTLADPPAAGFGLSRSLGFIVTGLLAKRHGVRVRLGAAEGGGTTADVLVPADLLTTADSDDLPLVDREEDEVAEPQPDEPVADGSPVDDAPLQALLNDAAQPSEPRKAPQRVLDLDVPGIDRRQRLGAPSAEGAPADAAPAEAAPADSMPAEAAPQVRESITDAPSELPGAADVPAADPDVPTPEAPAADGGDPPPADQSPSGPVARSAPTGGADDPAPPAPAPAELRHEPREQPRGPAAGRTFREALPRRRATVSRGKSSWSLPAPAVPKEAAKQEEEQQTADGRAAPDGTAAPSARTGGGGRSGEAAPLPKRKPRAAEAPKSDSNGNGGPAPLPRRSPGATGGGSQPRPAGFLADEPAAAPAHKDTSDILARYLTGMNRTKQQRQSPEEGEAASSAPSHRQYPGREDQ